MIVVRAAVADDAAAMSAVLIASISELCAADHHNNPEILAGWLANKTPQGVAAWLTHPGNVILVAERDGEIAAVGGYNGREIVINYVAPRHRFAGVSKAMLAALEAGIGPGEARLDSTETARRFYTSCGWESAGEPSAYRGVSSYPMRKLLG